MSSTADLVAAARLWAVDRQPYLAFALFALSLREAPGQGTVAVDAAWRLYVDPETLDSWSTPNLGSALVHEVHHLLRDHAGRAGRLAVGAPERLRWNVAADLEINDDLRDLELPPGGVFPETFGLDDGDLAEGYFLALEGRSCEGQRCGSCVDGVEEGEGGGGEAGDGVRPVEAALIRQRVAQEVLRRQRAGGHVPGGIARWAEALVEPTVDWRTRLAVAVRTGLATISGAVDYSYRRPSRRAGSPVGRGVILPGLVQPRPRVGVIVDTSASVTDGDLAAALSEVTGILRSCAASDEGVTVVSCDTAARTVNEVVDVRRIVLAGGGGTDLRAGFSVLAAHRRRPQIVVAITDAFTPWPAGRHPFDWVVAALVGAATGPVPEWAVSVRIPPGRRDRALVSAP